MGSIKVIKVGGQVLDNEEMLDQFLLQFSSLSGPKILVHGGGVKATQIADRLGISSVLKEGRRITDDQMIDVVIMTYGGLLNRKLVAKLQANKINAIGLTGADGGLMLSGKRPPAKGVDYGWVGDPEQVNNQWLHELIEKGMVPVIAPLTHDGIGHLLNTNADTIARWIAISLQEIEQVSLVYAFELAGVFDDLEDQSSLVKVLTYEAYCEKRATGIVSSGMLPKLDNAFKAYHTGVKEVVLMKYDEIKNLNNDKFNECTRLH